MADRDNADLLVETRVMGQVTSPELSAGVYAVDRDGLPFVPIGSGGIKYNVKVGMSAFGWAGDQVEPGVSLAHPQAAANAALSTFACVGNTVQVRTGMAAGALGTVTGKHEEFVTYQHVLVDFDEETLAKLCPGDQAVVRAHGTGLALADASDVTLHSLDPGLWRKLTRPARGQALVEIPVVAVVPPHLVGIGSGRLSAATSICLQLGCRDDLGQLGLDDLRLGDLVAVTDWDGRYNTGYRPGAMLIGCVSTGTSRLAGYGPSLTILASGRGGQLGATIDPEANIARLLAVGTWRQP